METAKFEYLGNAITFQRDNGSVMVNATEMAKPFNKPSSEWLRLPSTLTYLNALEAMGKSHRSESVKTINGKGTWMHEDVAMEFARWLSPAFAIWCNDRTKELLKYGATAVNPDDLLNPDFIIKLATELKQERAKSELLQARSEAQQEQLKESAPKVQYFDEVLRADGLIPTTIIAKELGMSAIGLNKFLHEKRVQYWSSGTWVLYHEYQDKGYTGTKTATYTDSFGKIRTQINTCWTEKGRNFIHSLVSRFRQSA